MNKFISKHWTPKSLKKKRPAPYGATFTDEELEELEAKFIENYVKSEVKPLSMVFRIYMRYWKELLLCLLFFFLRHSPVFVLPIVTANIINYVAYTDTISTQVIIINIVVMIALLILNVPMHTLYSIFFNKVMRRVEAGLRGAMVRKLQQLSITFHKEMQSGRIQSKLMRDVESIHTLATQLFGSLPITIITIIVSLAIVVQKNLTVFAFFVVCIPVAVLLVRVFRSRMAKSNKAFRVSMENTSASLMDMVTMNEITRAHGLEDKEVKKLSERLKDVANTGLKLDVIQNLFGSSTWVTFQIFQFSCLLFSSYLAFKGRIPVGDISLYQTYFTSITGNVSNLVGLLPLITKGLDSVSSIGEILSATDIEDNEGKKPVTELRGEYEFKNVAFSYEKDKKLLENFSLHVRAGETIAFVGESGCGKTTSMNLILGFNKATIGTLTVDGVDINDIDLHTYRSHIAIVPQNSVLFTGTIRENITYGVDDITDEKLMKAVEAARLSEFIASLPEGLDTMLYEHGANLSGGQRQRISIARAIIRDPSVIIFDEATSALDSVSEREIQRAIDNLTHDRTTFIVAHRLSTIKNADRIAVLRNGRCEELGSYDELMDKKGLFYEMQTAQ